MPDLEDSSMEMAGASQGVVDPIKGKMPQLGA